MVLTPMRRAYSPRSNLLSAATLLLSLVFITVAFCTPYWLVNDGIHPGTQKFRRRGLWEVCFDSPLDDHYRVLRLLRFDNDNRGCRWIFDREYRYLRPLLEAPYFVAVQIFFTIGFGLLVASCGVLLGANICMPPEKEVQMLRATVGLILASTVCNLVAIIVFGALGDITNDYIPQVDWNYFGWSYVLAVVGVIIQLIAAIFAWMDARAAAERDYEDSVMAMEERLRDSASLQGGTLSRPPTGTLPRPGSRVSLHRTGSLQHLP
ncbi:uncharacterized protein LOC100903569 [Galendromus occidentalis]|uniref:Uncharacterized protein LOC100903569 n=1 Tax=Galendromus occidentalis TaxID=34638 RepID=A0AAJ6QW90_9ACAR|nr:uncharacterized protein LOC100903569 [Galendromus occidentalis]